jgi:hypothetical protein
MSKRSLAFLIFASALLALLFTSARAASHHHAVSIAGGHR